MRLLALLGLASIACDDVGYVTGGTVCEEFSLTEEELTAVELIAAQKLCKRDRIKEMLDGRPCTANLINAVMRKACIYWGGHGAADGVACFEPEEL